MGERRDFDLLVIGAGTGGMGVARRCAQAGLSVAITDERPYGGTCALRGCDPKKVLVGVTEALDQARRLEGRGLEARVLQADWSAMMAFKRSFTDPMPERAEKGLQDAGVQTFHGHARFVSPNDVLIEGDAQVSVRASRFHIATGARPRPLDIPGESRVINSTDFLELPALPPRICFIGGGFISFEFSHVARRAGARKVTVLHRGDHPLEAFDPDLVGRLLESTRALGIDVRLRSRVTGVEKDGELRVLYDDPDGWGSVPCDLVVHGAGRVADLDDMGLDEAHVAWGPRGVQVTRALRCVTNPAVYAAGDAADTGAPALTPVAAYDARIAAENILAGEDVAEVDYPSIPSVVFTGPPLARVGLLEAEATEKGMDYEVHHVADTTQWYSSLRVAAPTSGFKTLVDRDSGRILGAHVLGPGAEEQINVLSATMKAGLTANQIKGIVFAYPSFSSDLASMT